VAARSFRERCGDSSGLGTVMKKVGLKKGGYYRFKDDLFVCTASIHQPLHFSTNRLRTRGP
jgi:hypothetical protein